MFRSRCLWCVSGRRFFRVFAHLRTKKQKCETHRPSMLASLGRVREEKTLEVGDVYEIRIRKYHTLYIRYSDLRVAGRKWGGDDRSIECVE